MKKIVLLAMIIILSFPQISATCGNNQGNQQFAFAIITDFHLEYFGKDARQKLHATVDAIIAVKDKFNLSGVIGLGDGGDKSQKCDFVKVREELSRLNDVGLFFILTIGNHETWEYTMIEGADPDDRTKITTIADAATADQYFEEVFWGPGNQRNIDLIKKALGNSWEKSKNPVIIEGVNHPVYLQNYGFSYGGITFLTIDLAPRADPPLEPRYADIPSARPGDPRGFLSVLHMPTLDFAKVYTKNHASEKRILITFCHYRIMPYKQEVVMISSPMLMEEYINQKIGNFVTNPENYKKIYNFYGHTHNTEDDQISKTFNIVTEDVAEINLGLVKEGIVERKGTPIRIVKIGSDGSVDYSTLLAREMIPSEIIAKTAQNLAGINSFHFELDQIGGGVMISDLIEVKKASGDVVRPDRLQTKIDITVGGLLPNSFDLIAIKDTVYVNSPLSGGKWEVLAQGAGQSGVFNPFAILSALLKNITGLAKIDEQTINGIGCFHISGSISSKALATATGASIADKSVKVEIWIGKNDFRIYQVKLEGKLTQTEKDGIVRVLKISNFNQPVAISPP
ncbi:MAG: LppX_LprAFG lipoprotein [Candidatus Omnitrophota bacterium]